MRFLMALAACGLLAACAVEPRRPIAPPIPTPVATPPPLPAVAPLAAGEPGVHPADPWVELTSDFVLDDCADAPLVRRNEATYTRSPARFRQMLQRALPMVLFVRKQLQAAGVPGEFVMLPMLESSYFPHRQSHRGGSAGIWQLMPGTARAHGITIDAAYDGRLDPIASTRAAIALLIANHQRFGDWRLAAMAYNAGPNAVARALRAHPDTGDGAIPAIPLGATTREHLARLLALSCILKDPAQFRVTLPQPAIGDELAVVEVPAGTRLDSAAAMAGIPESRLRALNAGYLGSRVPAGSPRTLLLPFDAAQTLATAVASAASELVAQADAPARQPRGDGSIPLPEGPPPPPHADARAPASAEHAARHRVGKDETLWSIARRYGVSISDLRRWNHLQGDRVRIGALLRIAD